MTVLAEPIVFEKGDKFYFVGPVAPSTPSVQDIEEYAFGKSIVDDMKAKAPNEHIAWFAGHYLEADKPNRNGAMWTGSEIAVKGLTPMFMPVTVMHDPRTAVGLIADLKLLTPERDQVPRSKIDTALALWKHRFPEVVEEAQHNYENGSLMQSMECLAPDYECGACGMHFHKLPEGAEQENWCAHLKGEEGSTPVRILRSTVFTGTGLIYGSRGAQGADPLAHLESFQEEVAEFHTRTHDTPRKSKSKPKRKGRMEIEDAEYQRIIKERDEAKAAAAEAQSKLTDSEAAKAQAEKDLEAAETAKVAAETAKAEAEAKVKVAEETAAAANLATDRLGKLGTAFTAKLGDKTKERLAAQASTLQDEEWTARLEELEELTGVKVDEAAKDDTNGGKEFTPTEVARFKGSSHEGSGHQPSEGKRRSVIGSLVSGAKK